MSALASVQFAPTASAPASPSDRSDPASASPMIVKKPRFFRSNVSDTITGSEGAPSFKASSAIRASRRSVIVSTWRASGAAAGQRPPLPNERFPPGPSGRRPDRRKVFARGTDVREDEACAGFAGEPDGFRVERLAPVGERRPREPDRVRPEGRRVNGVAPGADVVTVRTADVVGARKDPRLGRLTSAEALVR